MCFAMTVGIAHGPLRYWTLFTYLAAASAVIVATSLRFFREPITFYASWVATWVIFCGWFAARYSHQEYFSLALMFLGVFFLLFYGTSLIARRLLAEGTDLTPNIATALLTGLVFYGFCLAIVFNLSPDFVGYRTILTYVGVGSAIMLASSFKFYGRLFMYLVIPLAWTIYGAWFAMRYDASQHFQLAVIFAGLYFALFYFSILFHRLVENNFTLVEHATLILGNGFVFYGFGYALLDRSPELSPYLGLYTAASSILHLVVLFAVRALSPKAIDVVQVLTILVLTLASLAVPVQFDGNVVTMVWAAEAAVLFGYGRMKGVRLFESYSYPVMILAVGKLFLDWSVSYTDRIQGVAGPLTPIANADFITALVFVIAFAFIYITNRNQKYEPAIKEELVRPFGIMLGVIGTFVLYNMFRIEIGNYFFSQSYNAASGDTRPVRPVNDLQTFNIAWQINYTLFFLVCTAAFNLKKLRSGTLAVANSILGVGALAIFSTASMFMFYVLRGAFMTGTFEPDVTPHWMYIAIRPISYVIAGALLYVIYEYSRDPLFEDRVDKSILLYGYDALAYTFVFIVASCELLNLMEQLRLPDGTKLGLSIFWGAYALILIVIGIAKDKKHLRIAAIALLAVTLVKLFFYDIAELDTIPKTILFVTLGITLLMISFLYNKYKSVIFKAGVTQED
ncbi:MAG TPA: DUF2339 domain-containing protein, partial [Pyrinomonadaceae bacterium]|nr:DUF2339 domain-containing protein [Pyrinomonadaceae bacterium]